MIKNPNGVYKDLENNAHYEVKIKNDIISLLKSFKG